MASIPLSIALPAATASLAYLNARTSFTSDFAFIRAFTWGGILSARAEKKNRLNLFYELEGSALSSKSRNRTFIAIPPAVSKDVQAPADLRGLECTEYSYKQVYDIVLQYAAWLKQEHGVQKGDVVALNYTNQAEFVFLWFAIWSLNAKAAFINTGLREESLLHCVKASTAKLLLLDPSLKSAMLAIQGGLDSAGVTTAVIDEVTKSTVRNTTGYRAPNEDRAGNKLTDLAVLIFTSGTTGLPKPAVVPWRKFYNSSLPLSWWLNVKPTDRYYTAMPLYHSSATILGLAIALHAGACFIISNHFSPSTFFASATASKATMMQYIGEMCRYLVSMPPSKFDQSHSIRLAFGNGLRPDVWQTFKDRFNITEIAEFYSATEAVSGSFIKSKNDFGRGAVGRSGTLMRLLAAGTTAIVKHDVETGEPWRDPKTGFCERVPLGESGELLNQLDPANIGEKYAGYWNNTAASNSKILRNVLKKGDAWYRTGDLLQADSQGRIFFTDRIGDTFRWKSENVSTTQISEVLSTCSHVSEANVYGVQLPNHDGRAGCAALVLHNSSSSSSKNNDDDAIQAKMKELATHARRKLPHYAVPVFLRVVREFEVTGTNKYTKHGLRTQGVDPGLTGEDQVFWLPPPLHLRSGDGKETRKKKEKEEEGGDGQGYVRFTADDWAGLVGGRVKL